MFIVCAPAFACRMAQNGIELRHNKHSAALFTRGGFFYTYWVTGFAIFERREVLGCTDLTESFKNASRFS